MKQLRESPADPCSVEYRLNLAVTTLGDVLACGDGESLGQFMATLDSVREDLEGLLAECREDFFGTGRYIGNSEDRVKYVVQRIDKANEAKGVAVKILGDFRRSKMTVKELAEQVKQDSLDLFGPEE